MTAENRCLLKGSNTSKDDAFIQKDKCFKKLKQYYFQMILATSQRYASDFRSVDALRTQLILLRSALKDEGINLKSIVLYLQSL